MIDLEKIKNEVAVKHGYKSFQKLLYSFYKDSDTISLEVQKVVNEVATEYARQMCDEQINVCAQEYVKPYEGMQRERVLVILNTPNVVKP